ncbi:MAG: lysophospholipase [Marinilabiliales bacterium]|nr:MAG: lysophospholipase [Marinilabiliales bacterium]
MPAKKRYTYLALGDSYTIGESVKSNECYPNLLVKKILDAGFTADTVTIIAKTGWTTDELIKGIAEKNIDYNNYDLVTLLIGVNNQYRGGSTENYRREFIDLLKQAIGFADNNSERVIVISIPDWGVTPFATDRDPSKIALEINAYNIINKVEAAALGVHYADITAISRRATTQSDLIAEDGLHPSAAMYKEWINVLYPIALSILKNQ